MKIADLPLKLINIYQGQKILDKSKLKWKKNKKYTKNPCFEEYNA